MGRGELISQHNHQSKEYMGRVVKISNGLVEERKDPDSSHLRAWQEAASLQGAL